MSAESSHDAAAGDPNRTPRIIAGVALIAVVAYLAGHARVNQLERHLDRQREQESRRVLSLVTELAEVRLSLLQEVREISLMARRIAEQMAAESYATGAMGTCRELVGDDTRCDQIAEFLNHLDYPGDPGYIPPEISRSALEIFPRAPGITARRLCANWLTTMPAASPTEADAELRATCRDFQKGM